MSSRTSIMLGTDGPDGGPENSSSGGGRVITPSPHVLAATQPAAAATATVERHSMSTSTGDGNDGIFITPRTASNGTGIGIGTDATAPASSGAFGVSASDLFGAPSASDVALEGLMGSALASLSGSTSAQARAPRSLAFYAGLDEAPVSSRRPLASLQSEMDELSAALAAVLESGPKGAQEQKDNEIAAELLQGEHTVTSTAAAAAAAPPTGSGTAGTQLSLCFDLISSTASRIPFSTIIAASAAAPVSGAAASAAASSVGGFAMDGYVAVEPVDWSRHHAETVFAKLTGVNRGADQLDDIAIELAHERDELREKLEASERTVQEQRRMIEQLQRQLREGATASHAPPAASSATAVGQSVAVPIASEDDESGEEFDIDEGMADEEDMNSGVQKSSTSSRQTQATTFGTQT